MINLKVNPEEAAYQMETEMSYWANHKRYLQIHDYRDYSNYRLFQNEAIQIRNPTKAYKSKIIQLELVQ